jgi:hypothetical protein
MLLMLDVDIHKDKKALEHIGWYEERKKMLECIKGKPLSIQKEILKAYEEKFGMPLEDLDS